MNNISSKGRITNFGLLDQERVIWKQLFLKIAFLPCFKVSPEFTQGFPQSTLLSELWVTPSYNTSLHEKAFLLPEDLATTVLLSGDSIIDASFLENSTSLKLRFVVFLQGLRPPSLPISFFSSIFTLSCLPSHTYFSLKTSLLNPASFLPCLLQAHTMDRVLVPLNLAQCLLLGKFHIIIIISLKPISPYHHSCVFHSVEHMI